MRWQKFGGNLTNIMTWLLVSPREAHFQGSPLWWHSREFLILSWKVYWRVAVKSTTACTFVLQHMRHHTSVLRDNISLSWKNCCFRMIADLNAQLEYERIRREKLEVQLDELRLENARLRDEIEQLNATNMVRISKRNHKHEKSTCIDTSIK